MQDFFKIIGLLIVVLLGGCIRSETELLESVEAKIRSDPFILSFRQNMEHAFGCKAESKVGFQEMSVYMSLYSTIGLRQPEGKRTQVPEVHVMIYCHSSIVSRVYLDLNLWRGNVGSFDQFERIEPLMISRIRFEQANGLEWYMTARTKASGDSFDLATAAINTPIWKGFMNQVSSMFANGCAPLDKSAVFFNESAQMESARMMFAGRPYQEFLSVLSCRKPKPGPLTPGFKFKGRFFPGKGFVLPLEIESGGAYE